MELRASFKASSTKRRDLLQLERANSSIPLDTRLAMSKPRNDMYSESILNQGCELLEILRLQERPMHRRTRR